MVCLLVGRMESSFKTCINMNEIVEKLQAFIEIEGQSCSFDQGLITPEYVYRMWGGSVAIDEIATGLTELRKNGFTN